MHNYRGEYSDSTPYSNRDIVYYGGAMVLLFNGRNIEKISL